MVNKISLYKISGIAAKCFSLQSLCGFRKIVQNEQIGPDVVHKYVERSDFSSLLLFKTCRLEKQQFLVRPAFVQDDIVSAAFRLFYHKNRSCFNADK